MSWRDWSRLLLFAVFCGAIALAQYTNATISGVVYDPGGAVVAGRT